MTMTEQSAVPVSATHQIADCDCDADDDDDGNTCNARCCAVDFIVNALRVIERALPLLAPISLSLPSLVHAALSFQSSSLFPFLSLPLYISLSPPTDSRVFAATSLLLLCRCCLCYLIWQRRHRVCCAIKRQKKKKTTANEIVFKTHLTNLRFYCRRSKTIITNNYNSSRKGSHISLRHLRLCLC